MGKQFTFTLALMVAANGFWYCATQQPTMGETPIIILPSVASVVVGIFTFFWVKKEWD